MKIQPIIFVWQEVEVICPETGVAERTFAMVPIRRQHNIAKSQFSAGEQYTLTPFEERSQASHGHYFAALREGVANLPESICARWGGVEATVGLRTEHFRKWALIETGWFDEKEFVFDSATYAGRFASHYHEDIDSFARLFWPGNGKKIILRRARSQSYEAMGKDDFEKSKRDVLDLLSHFLDINRSTLQKNAGRSA